jgi:cystathionine gamma-lyase
LEERLAVLENAKYGLAFASGLAAETTLALSLLRAGDHVVAFEDLYGGTHRLFDKILSNYGLEFSYVDASATENVEKAIKPNTRLIWLESPSNPLLRLCDIKAIAAIAKKHQVLVVVDNTFASPYLQNPLDLGADIVLHSTTKYINGHSDAIGGAIMTSNDELYAKLKFSQNALGGVPSPFDSYLVLRGTKTLGVRMERHCQNAQKIAEYLSKHPKVENVIYPGLETHPQHVLAKRQMSGFGGMITFTLKGEAAEFLKKLKVIALAESLGGVESLIEYPDTMSHASMGEAARREAGITEKTLRISVGIEHPDDLVADFRQALG